MVRMMPNGFAHQSRCWQQRLAKEEMLRSKSVGRIQPCASAAPGGWSQIGTLTPPTSPSPLGYSYSSRSFAQQDYSRPFGQPFKPAVLPPLERSHTKLQLGGTPLIFHNSPHQPRMEPEAPRLFRRCAEQSTRSATNLPVPVLAWKTNPFYGTRGNM